MDANIPDRREVMDLGGNIPNWAGDGVPEPKPVKIDIQSAGSGSNVALPTDAFVIPGSYRVINVQQNLIDKRLFRAMALETSQPLAGILAMKCFVEGVRSPPLGAQDK